MRTLLRMLIFSSVLIYSASVLGMTPDSSVAKVRESSLKQYSLTFLVGGAAFAVLGLVSSNSARVWKYTADGYENLIEDFEDAGETPPRELRESEEFYRSRKSESQLFAIGSFVISAGCFAGFIANKTMLDKSKPRTAQTLILPSLYVAPDRLEIAAVIRL